MDANTNSLNWFEISVEDMQRAKHFYQIAFGVHLEETEMMGMHMAVFPMDPGNGKVGGALVKSDVHRPSLDGAIIYLNADPDLGPVLERIEKEHGRVLMPKTLINDQIGYMAFFTDTEGNRLGLHSRQ